MMKLTDYIEQSLSNLSKKKLRTFLTTSGVVIGIGALVCMFAFGQGVQYTITERFEKMDLLNYVTIYKGERPRVGRRGRDRDPDAGGVV